MVGAAEPTDTSGVVFACRLTTGLAEDVYKRQAEKNAYGSLAFSLQNERNLPTAATLRDGLDVPHTRNISLGQKNTLPKYSVYGKATNC